MPWQLKSAQIKIPRYLFFPARHPAIIQYILIAGNRRLKVRRHISLVIACRKIRKRHHQFSAFDQRHYKCVRCVVGCLQSEPPVNLPPQPWRSTKLQQLLFLSFTAIFINPFKPGSWLYRKLRLSCYSGVKGCLLVYARNG